MQKFWTYSFKSIQISLVHVYFIHHLSDHWWSESLSTTPILLYLEQGSPWSWVYPFASKVVLPPHHSLSCTPQFICLFSKPFWANLERLEVAMGPVISTGLLPPAIQMVTRPYTHTYWSVWWPLLIKHHFTKIHQEIAWLYQDLCKIKA